MSGEFLKNKDGSPRLQAPRAGRLPSPEPAPIIKGGQPKTKLSRFGALPEDDPTWGPYAKMAEQFRKHYCAELARMAGGKCSAGPSSIVQSAALQLAVSRWLTTKAANENDPQLFKLASQMMNDSRQNLLAAYELAVREAKARNAKTEDPHEVLDRLLIQTMPTNGTS